ncbi:MAG: hypothetical protein EXR57_03220 [Dehalococcoidia bacterium]|nr:hypothetical protein [Dehalococcoidia bacterium]MSQ34813.1 hypothetical protein [Dehalococcoidia bacterium]
MTSDSRQQPGVPVGAHAPVDAERLRESLTRLYDIYQKIAEKADDSFNKRCPYKDARSRCTANFGCRNQFFPKDRFERPVCSGSDKLDYRTSWDV